jgi:ABC-2 type transport system permease protein
MAVAAPGSFAWLARHELRLAWRGRSKGWAAWLGLALGGLWLAVGCFIAWGLMDVPIPFTAWAGTGVLAAAVVMLSFMTTQAILGSQQTFYERRDLDLMFTAPIDGRTVLLAKLVGIAGAIVTIYALLILPLALPVAVLGHPGLLGVAGVLAALAMAASAIGIAITLVLAKVAGPRAARTVGQVSAAVLGGALFLASQLARGGKGRESSIERTFRELHENGLGSTGWSGIPGHAAFGDALSLVVMRVVGIALFAGAGLVLRRLFLSGYQDATMTLSRSKPTGKATARLFHAGLFRSVLAKEWRLLARDPALLFQMVLRLVYMAPIVMGAMQGGGRLFAPSLAFASVLVATQLAGSLAWLTVSAEDAPELITVAPVHKESVDTAKLTAALLMAAPFAVIIPAILATVAHRPLGALMTMVLTAIGGALAGFIELKLGKPGQRASFAKRRQGGFVSGILGIFVALLFGGTAGLAVYLIGG